MCIESFRCIICYSMYATQAEKRSRHFSTPNTICHRWSMLSLRYFPPRWFNFSSRNHTTSMPLWLSGALIWMVPTHLCRPSLPMRIFCSARIGDMPWPVDSVSSGHCISSTVFVWYGVSDGDTYRLACTRREKPCSHMMGVGDVTYKILCIKSSVLVDKMVQKLSF